MDENHYPSYARPQNGFTYTVQRHNPQGQQTNITFTNQHVVPYNPHLSMLLGCHVNVEFCANLLGSIKYIHKYISKGPDHATIVISPDGAADEIHHYQDCCYIGPAEAMWHIFQFSLHGSTPNVYCLQLHLQGENQVYFDPEQGLPDALERAANRRSMLDAFYIVSELLCKFDSVIIHSIQANQQYDAAKDVLYQDFPSYFTWKPKEMVWTPRRKGYAIGRIYNCGTRAGDCFCLRLLLTHVKGPQSEQHLCTVDGVQHATCKDACVALGLLEDDGEWHQCLTEACQVQVGVSVRRLFAVILAYNSPTHFLELWLEFNRQMCDDLLRWRRYPLRQTLSHSAAPCQREHQST